MNNEGIWVSYNNIDEKILFKETQVQEPEQKNDYDNNFLGY